MDEKSVKWGGEEGESSRVHPLPFHLSFLVGRVIVLLQVLFFHWALWVELIISKRGIHISLQFLVLRNG